MTTEAEKAVRILQTARKGGAHERVLSMVREFEQPDDMCPNCVTPWKCNGPHFAHEHDYELVEVCKVCGLTGTVREWTP